MAMDTSARERPRLSARSVDETLENLIRQILPDMRRLLEAGQNFKVTINASAGHTFEVEIVKRMTF